MGMDKAAPILSIMSGYGINVAKWISHEIRDRDTNTDKLLDFPYMLTQIYLEKGVPEIPDIDRFLRSRTTTNLGLIRDITNPI